MLYSYVNQILLMMMTELNEGEDAIFCEGECQIWLHRKCVGLIKNTFTLIGK